MSNKAGRKDVPERWRRGPSAIWNWEIQGYLPLPPFSLSRFQVLGFMTPSALGSLPAAE